MGVTERNLNAQEFNERFYPAPTERVPMPKVELVRQREHRISNTYHRVMWLHSFGEWLYYDVIGVLEAAVFDGTHAGLQQLIKDGWVRKPVRAFPKAVTNQALTFYSLHTPKRWQQFCNEANYIGVESYRKWLGQFGKPNTRRQLSAAHMETARIKKA